MVCHRVLCHPSEHGTSSMGKHLLAKADITKLNEFTEWGDTELTSSTVHETALAILKRLRSRGIRTISPQSQMLFDIQVIPYSPKWQTNGSKLTAKDFETSEFHHDTWNHYLMLGIVSPCIPWNTISKLWLWQSYNASTDDLVRPSPMTPSNICLRQHPLTLDASQKQLPWWNEVS